MARFQRPRKAAKRTAKKTTRRAIFAAACLLLSLSPLLVLLPGRWIDPPTTAFILRERLETGRWPERAWTDWHAIAPTMRLAAVAAEDQLFPTHHGFDVQAIRDVLDSEGGRPRGASTISQQLAKNLFLWPGRSWIRKGIEAYLTVWIEIAWPKRRILEVYLNVAEFGPGVYGVGAAGATYFDRHPDALTASQAARLAAVLPNPKERSPRQPSAAVRERAAWIERQMRQLGSDYLDGL